MYRNFSLALTLLTLTGTIAGTAHGQFASLAHRVPNDANAIVFIDVDKVMASPMAEAAGWKENVHKAFESGLVMLPPNVDRFVASAKIDFHSMEVPSHHYVFETAIDPDLVKIAVALGGTIDNFNGHSAAVLPGDYFVVKFSPKISVIGSPAVRQDVALYVRRVDKGLMTTSEYFKEAETFAEYNSPIVMALDLADSVPRDLVRAKAETMESLKGKNLDLDAVADLVASIRGLTFGVNVAQEMTGSVKVDFGSDVSVLGDAAKPLLLEVLGNRGMMIDELRDWEVQSNAKSIRLIGKLEASGLRRIMSLIPVPPPLQQAREAEAQVPEGEAKEKLAVATSQNYFKSVSSLVDDLKQDKQDSSAINVTAVYFDRYADRIDKLPTVNVDPYLLELGAYVSGSLRNGSSALRGAAYRGRVADLSVQQQYDYSSWYTPIGVVGSSEYRAGGVYGWGGWAATPNYQRTSALKLQARLQEQMQGKMSANEIMAQVEKAVGDTRRQMTTKYQVEF